MNIAGIADSIANQRHVAAVRRGVLLDMPLVVIGAFATMMSEVSVLWYQQLMISWFEPNWALLWHVIASASRNGISILLADRGQIGGRWICFSSSFIIYIYHYINPAVVYMRFQNIVSKIGRIGTIFDFNETIKLATIFNKKNGSAMVAIRMTY